MSRVEVSQNNFIRKIIDNDLLSGNCTTVHTRFPPEPNGHLHIGHAKAIYLNFSIANDYQGLCNLRFDDTNPLTENQEFIESIKYDIQWMGFKWNGYIRYASDYFDQLYDYAVELISKGVAYVDNLSIDEIREYRGTLKCPGKNSPYRDRSIEENISLFAKMRNGDFPEGSACLRAKIDMGSTFMVMRDPVLYRIKFARHHQTGTKWCIYPMYDFTHCISDALENITHSLCTLEFQDNRRLYDWILNNLSIKARPKQYEFSRLNLEYTLTSKRQLNYLVTKKIVDGWDDPRMPSISGLRRRGYTAASIREFCRRIGVTKQESHVEIAMLEACIREDLNKNAPRAMAVIDPIKIVIDQLPEGYEEHITVPVHPNNPNMGTRQIVFSNEIYIERADFIETASNKFKRLTLGKEVRLRHAYIIKAESVEKDNIGNITLIHCSYDVDTMKKKPYGRKVHGVIHWVSAIKGVPAAFYFYNLLFREANPGKLINLLSALNPKSLVIHHGFVENSVLAAKPGDSYQFEREGYFCADNRNYSTEKLIFNRIVSIRDTAVY